MSSKITFGGYSNPEDWTRSMEDKIREGVNQLGEKIYNQMVVEAPSSEDKGYMSESTDIHPRPLKQDIKWVRARLIAPGVFRISFSFPKYVNNLINGVTYDEGIYHTAKDIPSVSGKKSHSMRFAEETWPKGFGTSNGFYFFKAVRYHVTKNDFISRAFSKVRRSAAYREFGEYLADMIRFRNSKGN